MSNYSLVHGDEPNPGHRLPMLYNLMYCSQAGTEIDEAAVTEIINISKRKNPAQGITGLLVYGSGIFFQWIEGPRDNMMRLMATISADKRHNNVVLLSSNDELHERMFPDWDMELVTGDDIRDVLADAFENATDPKNRAVLLQLQAQLDSGELGNIGRA